MRQEKNMRNLAGVMALMALSGAALADSVDAAFYKKAAEGGIFEVEAGNLAQQKGTSQSVKDFGAMMVKDHGAANEKLSSLAASKNIGLPTSASVPQMATETKLKVLSGGTFDKSYIKSQVKAHQATIALFKKEASSGEDPEAKAFASATLPTLRAHLKQINTMATEAGEAK